MQQGMAEVRQTDVGGRRARYQHLHTNVLLPFS